MDYKSARVFATTIGRRAITDIRKDGFRQLRNYVDMCAVLANRPNQKAFFDRAQETLEKTDSQYYSLVRRLVDEVEDEHLCTVFTDLCFDGLIYGASRMKQASEQSNAPCSWLKIASCGDPALPAQVQKAEEEGCFVWLLYAQGEIPQQTAALAKQYPYSAFVLMAEPAAYDSPALESVTRQDNIIPQLLLQKPELDAAALAITHSLRERKRLFGLAVPLDDTTLDRALCDAWLDQAAREGLVCLYARKPGMSEEGSQRLYNTVVAKRVEPSRPLLLLDWDKDLPYINHALSPYAVTGNLLQDKEGFPFQI